MRWVTFYYSILGGVQNLEYHKDMPTALAYFRRHYQDFFAISAPFRPTKLPASYGFPHRKYMGMSIRNYNKYWKEAANANAKA